jgi:hypothetical protein
VFVARVTAPVSVPVVVGSNAISSVAVLPALSVSGNVNPDIEKPVPVTAPALIISGAVPDEVMVTDSVSVVFGVTSPNATLLVLSVSPGVEAARLIVYVLVTLPDVADRVAVCPVVTADAVAVKAAVVVPDATVTLAGTVTAELLLARLIVRPLEAAPAVSVTAQLSDPAPVMDALLQLTALRAPVVCVAVPLRAITAVPADVFVARLTVPLSVPLAVGSNVTVRVAVLPGFSVSGNASPEIAKPVPVTAPALIVSGEVPEDVSVTVAELVEPTATLPNATLLCPRVSPGTTAPSLIA